MYEVDSQDAVIRLSNAPDSDTGAPLPQLLVTENRLLLAYLIFEPDPHWDGTYTNLVSQESDGLSIAIVDLVRPTSHMFGGPNDEAFHGHPLADRGLRPYGVFEVGNSSWIRKLEEMNSVHHRHNKKHFMANRRHFIFAFHDTTFECIAHSFAVDAFHGSMRAAFDRMFAISESRQV